MINRAWNRSASFRLTQWLKIIPHMNEPVIFSHCVHLKLGHPFHALLEVCCDRDDTAPLRTLLLIRNQWIHKWIELIIVPIGYCFKCVIDHMLNFSSAAPEVLHEDPYFHAIDWWSLGILMYTLLTGSYPIKGASNHHLMCSKVIHMDYSLPELISSEANQLVAEVGIKIEACDFSRFFLISRFIYFFTNLPLPELFLERREVACYCVQMWRVCKSSIIKHPGGFDL